jgi:hypothetical protein
MASQISKGMDGGSPLDIRCISFSGVSPYFLSVIGKTDHLNHYALV